MKRLILAAAIGTLGGNLVAWSVAPDVAFTVGNILLPSLYGTVTALIALVIPSPFKDLVQAIADRFLGGAKK